MISGHISSFGSECFLFAYLPRRWKSSQFRHEVRRRLSTFPDVMDNRKMRTAERRGRASRDGPVSPRALRFCTARSFTTLFGYEESCFFRSTTQRRKEKPARISQAAHTHHSPLLFCVPVPTHVRSHSIFVRPSRIRGKN